MSNCLSPYRKLIICAKWALFSNPITYYQMTHGAVWTPIYAVWLNYLACTINEEVSHSKLIPFIVRYNVHQPTFTTKSVLIVYHSA